MRLYSWLVIALSFASVVFAQNPQADMAALSPQLQSELALIRDAALRDDYAYQQVAHLTENIGARPAGSAQAQAAVDYVAGEMRKLGLDIHLEDVMVRRWERGAETAELVQWPGQAAGTTQKIVVTALGGNAPTSIQGITGEVVWLRISPSFRRWVGTKW